MKFQIVSNIPKIWIVRSCCFLVWKMKRKYISLFTNFYRYSEISYLKILFGFCSVANVCLDWYATWYVNMDCQRKLSILVQIPNYIFRNKNSKILEKQNNMSYFPPELLKNLFLIRNRIRLFLSQRKLIVLEIEGLSVMFMSVTVDQFKCYFLGHWQTWWTKNEFEVFHDCIASKNLLNLKVKEFSCMKSNLNIWNEREELRQTDVKVLKEFWSTRATF